MKIRFHSSVKWLALAGLLIVAAVAFSTGGRWLAAARQIVQASGADTPTGQSGCLDDEHAHDPDEGQGGHAEEDHAHEPGETCNGTHELESAAQAGADPTEPDHSGHAEDEHDVRQDPNFDHVHDEALALKLSKQAEANIGLDLVRVEPRPFAPTISVPATVVERPGRSRRQITATFTGLVTRIYRIPGEVVKPGMPLFDLQLTHEELVEAQADFLRTGEELEVVNREVARVAEIAAQGAIAGKALLERQYEQQKLEAAMLAQRQRLLLHRLSPKLVDDILKTKQLLQHMTVTVPATADQNDPAEGEHLVQVQELKVQKGQHVTAGDPLAVLVDYGELFIEGKAFEQDIPALTRAVKNHWTATAVFQENGNRENTAPELKILYLASEVQLQSRAFAFYVVLPNRPVRDTTTPSGERFIDWQYKPGQRLRLLVPTEAASPRIVLPNTAVVQDGAEAYVFEYNRDHFDRRAVHVEYRDQDRVVIANDGSLKPGVRVAVSGAYQIHLATKNKGGNPIDAHAGHNH